MTCETICRVVKFTRVALLDFLYILSLLYILPLPVTFSNKNFNGNKHLKITSYIADGRCDIYVNQVKCNFDKRLCILPVI